ncbi:MAG: hypothetical protein ACQCN3_02105 [Candidatus Bathyarchaeia archaeon]|jgi:hypothetical protein
MENKMKSDIKFKIGLLLPILVLVGLFAAFWAASILSTPAEEIIQRQPPGGLHPVSYDFEFFYFAHAIISTVNVALLAVLLITYISVYRKTKSEFSFGLIIFGFAFLLKDLVSSPFTASVFSFYPSGLGPFIVLPDLFEFAALSVLLYLSIKY